MFAPNLASRRHFACFSLANQPRITSRQKCLKISIKNDPRSCFDTCWTRRLLRLHKNAIDSTKISHSSSLMLLTSFSIRIFLSTTQILDEHLRVPPSLEKPNLSVTPWPTASLALCNLSILTYVWGPIFTHLPSFFLISRSSIFDSQSVVVEKLFQKKNFFI